MVAEGLSAMMMKASFVGEFDSFQFNDSVQFEILQFVDDTMVIGDGS